MQARGQVRAAAKAAAAKGGYQSLGSCHGSRRKCSRAGSQQQQQLLGGGAATAMTLGEGARMTPSAPSARRRAGGRGPTRQRPTRLHARCVRGVCALWCAGHCGRLRRGGKVNINKRTLFMLPSISQPPPHPKQPIADLRVGLFIALAAVQACCSHRPRSTKGLSQLIPTVF